MAGEVAERAAKGGKKGLRRPKRRISIRIDMTPMVDIAFLLLIFYMVSTVFAMPQAMEINLPPKDNVEVKLPPQNVMTLRVDQDGRFWWNIGVTNADSLPILLPSKRPRPDSVAYILNPDTLRGLMIAQNRLNAKLNTIILIHPKANYANMIDILDEIDILQRGWNEQIAKTLNKKVEDLTREEKFSYRYAPSNWEDLEDKILVDALLAAKAKGEI